MTELSKDARRAKHITLGIPAQTLCGIPLDSGVKAYEYGKFIPSDFVTKGGFPSRAWCEGCRNIFFVNVCPAEKARAFVDTGVLALSGYVLKGLTDHVEQTPDPIEYFSAVHYLILRLCLWQPPANPSKRQADEAIRAAVCAAVMEVARATGGALPVVR